jgi:putative lipoprotein
MHLSVSANMLVRGVMAVVVLAVSACSKQSDDSQTAITGVLSADAPIAFEQGAQVQLRLTDVTGTDGAAVEVATVTIERIDGLPYAYRLPFDAQRIAATHRYTIDARVLIDGQLRYATDTPFAVLTQGNGRARDVVLAPAGANGSAAIATASPEPVASFQGTLHTGQETSNYSADWQNDSLTSIDEQRTLGKRVVRARYEYKGGYLLRYRDSTSVEMIFNDHGKPQAVTRAGRSVTVADAMDDINAARNRAAVLRSHALAGRETKQHRDETEQLIGNAVTR